MKKALLSLGLCIAIIGISSLATIWVLLTQEHPELVGQSKEIEFSILQNEPLSSIAQRLEAEDLVHSADLFLLYTRFRKTDGKIRAGTFSLERGQSIVGFHDALFAASEVLVSVVIPEGSTLRQIAARLESAGLVDAKAFEDFASANTVLSNYKITATSLQGFLFPDTYLFSRNASVQRIAEVMVDTFFSKLAGLGIDRANFSPQELYQKTAMASIIEREYRTASEAPLIASVFYNRIEQRIPLQSCATVVYVITEEERQTHPSRLLFSDLKRDSLYNTYIHQGLPPSPIASPGTIALQASFSPAETDYLFFVVDADNPGTHIFSTRYEAHLAAAHLLYIKQET